MPQFGLIAEEVEKVNPDSVVRDDNGKVYPVRQRAGSFLMKEIPERSNSTSRETYSQSFDGAKETTRRTAKCCVKTTTAENRARK